MGKRMGQLKSRDVAICTRPDELMSTEGTRLSFVYEDLILTLRGSRVKALERGTMHSPCSEAASDRENKTYIYDEWKTIQDEAAALSPHQEASYEGVLAELPKEQSLRLHRGTDDTVLTHCSGSSHQVTFPEPFLGTSK